MKYSVWLNPTKTSEADRLLNETVKDLASRFAAPIFDAHVTLLADIEGEEEEVLQKVSQLAGKLSAFNISFNLFDFTDGLFQTLVIRAIPTKQLIEANKLARDLFERHGDALYTPHLSLLYRQNLENKQKIKIIEELKPKLIPSVDQPLEFTADKIYVYTSVPKIEDWRKVAEFPLVDKC